MTEGDLRPVRPKPERISGLWRPWKVVLFAWIPLAVLYVIAIVMMSGDQALSAIPYSLVSMGLAGILAFAIWWLTGVIRWPAHPSGAFYLAHLGLGLAHGLVWFLGAHVLRALLSGRGIGQALQATITSQFLGWNVLVGLLIYGLWAGISYAVREREASTRERVDAARAEAIAVRSQLTALEAQLNPHFLFNALNSLAGLVRSDSAKAEDAIDSLGDLMRYTLDRSGSDEVRLADEWEFVEDYVAIERLRLGDRLTVECQLDRLALSRRVPPFSVQALVENAIRHGIEPRSEGGRISIRIQSTEAGVVVEVEDDGVGADTRELETAHGFGLRALRERLAIGMRVRGSLTIQTEPGRGFLARLEVAPFDAGGPDIPHRPIAPGGSAMTSLAGPRSA